ncbi:MAG TPA: ABC transporter permease [Gemmataceae bacterium]|nr:ABC transporter permease [Gemmataceae bacterium]
MKKLLGIFVFLVVLNVLILFATDSQRWGVNHFHLGQRIGMSGILCFGAGLLIITGGVDLSIGSVVGLCACVFCTLFLDYKVPIPLAMLWTVAVGALAGLFNGLIVTYLRVQAFVVTLCGLFLFRGAARLVANDQQPAIGDSLADLNDFFLGEFLAIPIYLWLLIGIFVVTTVFLHFTIFGRYFFAIGSNEKAARYSGINVDFYKVLAYVLCSMFAGVYALLFVIHVNSVQPSDTGSFLELYAIAGAVLGGCSLRGGEGTTLGMFIGTAILVLLPNLINMWGISSKVEPTVVGSALLVCAIMDEWLRRRGASRA